MTPVLPALSLVALVAQGSPAPSHLSSLSPPTLGAQTTIFTLAALIWPARTVYPHGHLDFTARSLWEWYALVGWVGVDQGASAVTQGTLLWELRKQNEKGHISWEDEKMLLA